MFEGGNEHSGAIQCSQCLYAGHKVVLKCASKADDAAVGETLNNYKPLQWESGRTFAGSMALCKDCRKENEASSTGTVCRQGKMEQFQNEQQVTQEQSIAETKHKADLGGFKLW